MEPDSDKAHSRLQKELRGLDGKKSQDISRDVRLTSAAAVDIFDDDILADITLKGIKQDTANLNPLIKAPTKVEAKKISRALGTLEVAVEANKWEELVNARRAAEQLHYPIEKPDARRITGHKKSQPCMKTKLQKKVYDILQGAEMMPEKPETQEEKAIKKAMSISEVKERSREIWRARLLRERFEHKSYLRNKSKGKKFHNILRREKLRAEKARIEILKEEDPAAAIVALEELDRQRIEERLTLRHKASKWLKLQGPRVTKDTNVRDIMKENRRIREELLEKLEVVNTDLKDNEIDDLLDVEEDDIDNVINEQESGEEEESISPELLEGEIDPEVALVQQFWNEMAKMKQDALKNLEAKMVDMDTEVVASHTLPVKRVSSSKKLKVGKQTKTDAHTDIVESLSKPNEFEFSVPEEEEIEKVVQQNTAEAIKKADNKFSDTKREKDPMKSAKTPSTNILTTDDVESDEENRASQVEKVAPEPSGLEKYLGLDEKPEVESDNESEESEDLDKVMGDIFDDNLIEDFKNAKEKDVNDDKIKVADTFNPGWDHWAGPTIVPNKRIKRKMRFKAPQIKRKDDSLGNVIYRENCDVHKELRKQMVAEVPYPFKSVEDYEASVANPIGRQFVPEIIHKKLIKPKIVTKLGAVIKPIKDDLLVKQHNIVKKREANKRKREMEAVVKPKKKTKNNIKFQK